LALEQIDFAVRALCSLGSCAFIAAIEECDCVEAFRKLLDAHPDTMLAAGARSDFYNYHCFFLTLNRWEVELEVEGKVTLRKPSLSDFSIYLRAMALDLCIIAKVTGEGLVEQS
jgi:hypothetical protein